MGGTSKQTTTSTQQATPYAPAQGAIDGILGALNGQIGNAGLSQKSSGALDQIEANAAAGNPYAGLIGHAATGLLTGGGAQANDAGIRQTLADYQTRLSPIANGQTMGQNPALKSQLDTLLNDTMSSVNSQFAAAGRDGSALNQQALSRGFTQGAAPILAQQYNTDLQNQINAASALYGAGNSTYGLLNGSQAQANTNQVAGAGLGSQALDAQTWGANQILNAEQQRFAVPTGNLTTLLGAISPVAQAFGTQSGTSDTTGQMSGAQQFATIMGALSGLFPKSTISFGK